MQKINFVFGIHCHQPVGNFDFVFEEAFHRAYQPFLDLAVKYPAIKLNIHYTGILLEWIDRHHPEHIATLRKLVDRHQVEMLGGGFYEPILTVIPREDGLGQIHKLSDWISRTFRRQPRGMWLAERVWEPALPSLLNEAGMEYTVIDDTHFKYAGLQSDDLKGYFITEDNGKPLRIFPISQKLRYTIPFQKPEVTVDFLQEMASEDEQRLVIFADDGEKFGLWPGTFDFVHKRGWLDRFFALLSENSDWINMMHFSEALDTLKPAGRIYLPTASYAEMMHWALPAGAFREFEEFDVYLKGQDNYDQVNNFVRGGFWRNFMIKYPEVNQMHKKMLYLSRKAQEMTTATNSRLVQKARHHIWAGQCNCAYWHGVFGGIYLGHIRHANYQNFLAAEKMLRSAAGQADAAGIREIDFNVDGFNEILLETPFLNLYFEPEKGGRLTELDYLPANFNILNNVSRREEGYHRKLVEMEKQKNASAPTRQDDEAVASIHDMVASKQENLEQFLHYDAYDRKSLIDHFLAPGTTLEAFRDGGYNECGDFVNAPYRVTKSDAGVSTVGLEMVREGVILSGGAQIPARIYKHLRASRNSAIFEIDYRLEVEHDERIPVWFGVEFNFGLLAGYSEDRYFQIPGKELSASNLASSGEVEETRILNIIDEYNNFKIELSSDKAATIWRFPIETVSLSEGGFEKVYQGSTVLFLYRLELNGVWHVKFCNKFSDYGSGNELESRNLNE